MSIRNSERLAEAGIEPSVLSRGDSYDNALAETINGAIQDPPAGALDDQGSRRDCNPGRVSWFNHHRLLEPIGYIPPT